jgi:hypothetical protein
LKYSLFIRIKACIVDAGDDFCNNLIEVPVAETKWLQLIELAEQTEISGYSGLGKLGIAK